MLFPNDWTYHEPVSIGQQVRLEDGRNAKVVGFDYDQRYIKVKLPDDSQTTVPVGELVPLY